MLSSDIIKNFVPILCHLTTFLNFSLNLIRKNSSNLFYWLIYFQIYSIFKRMQQVRFYKIKAINSGPKQKMKGKAKGKSYQEILPEESCNRVHSLRTLTSTLLPPQENTSLLVNRQGLYLGIWRERELFSY